MTIHLNSQDINLLILHYLRERGLNHTAFMLEQESKLQDGPVPPGALINYLQKALLMEELNSHMQEEAALHQGFQKCRGEFRLMHSHICGYQATPRSLGDAANGLADDEAIESVTLEGHTTKVTLVDYQKSLVLSGSKDGTARLWKIGLSLTDWEVVSILPHVSGPTQLFEVRALSWNQYGNIASVASDGYVRLWTDQRVLLNTLCHESEVMLLQWDPSGCYLLTVSSESVKVWDSQGSLIQGFEQSKVEVFDAQWRIQGEFVTATSTGIWLWKVGEHMPRILESALNVKKIRWECEGR